MKVGATVPPRGVISNRWRAPPTSARMPCPLNCGCPKPCTTPPGDPGRSTRAATAWPTKRLVAGSSSVSCAAGGTEAGGAETTWSGAAGTVTGLAIHFDHKLGHGEGAKAGGADTVVNSGPRLHVGAGHLQELPVGAGADFQLRRGGEVGGPLN